MGLMFGKSMRLFREMEKIYLENATVGEEASRIASRMDGRFLVRVAAFSGKVIEGDAGRLLASFCNRVKEEVRRDYPGHVFLGALGFYPFAQGLGEEGGVPAEWKNAFGEAFGRGFSSSSMERDTDGDYCFALLFAEKGLYEEESWEDAPPPEKTVYLVCETNMTPNGEWPCAVFSDWNLARGECLRLAEKTRKLAEDTHRDVEGARRAARFYVERVEEGGMHGFGVRVKRISGDGSESEGEWDSIFYVEKYVLDKSSPKWI